MKISEFAERAEVTVKTLLHYDKIGLLKPAQRTDSGYRVYCEEDFLMLQQINTLKFIGLSLADISHILSEQVGNLEGIIQVQKIALEEKKKNIESVITVFNKAENQIKKNGFLEVENLIDIIKITNMEYKVKKQYKTAENFNLRGNLHSHNINKIDWNHWCFNKMKFPNKARILELGCGTGDLWNENRGDINEGLSITVSDFSKGMLYSTKERLEQIGHSFTYVEIDAQDIPYKDECFDVVIARHMLYFVPDIEKALGEIHRILVKGGMFYATTNSAESMAELNDLVEKFDSKIRLNNNGMCERFDLENGQPLLKKYFNEVKMDTLEGKIVVNDAEPIISYKASTIKGSSILVGEKKQAFRKYLESYIAENGNISITTKACIFKAKK
ncbi:MerR family transcriptional regulator [Clostridium sp. CF012]|uniref:MerR family transcriptional regulator n=1 Tax=Clostridium sp. CF012 TaxID=2843319 RepID=UPI001C0CEC93|nr:MerR family transcriptional regulator [Clostridium sp. CF012]MBU3143850.1 methyltransferase domain-containing protein [Clostridium sp. CF012]